MSDADIQIPVQTVDEARTLLGPLDSNARLIRDGVVVFDSRIASLRRFKDDASEVHQGFECGLTLERFGDYKVGDVVEAYLAEEVRWDRL